MALSWSSCDARASRVSLPSCARSPSGVRNPCHRQLDPRGQFFLFKDAETGKVERAKVGARSFLVAGR